MPDRSPTKRLERIVRAFHEISEELAALADELEVIAKSLSEESR